MAQLLRSKLGCLDAKSTLFLLCDVQEKFRAPIIPLFPAIVKNSQKLLTAGQHIGCKLIVSEQNPEKLGKTANELPILHAVGVFPKLEFSMYANAALGTTVKEMTQIQSVVLFGLEAHICVEQTAIDLLSNNYAVHIVADCTASRSDEDRRLAFQRLRQIGCFITTSENVIFKLMQSKEHPKFNDIRQLVKDVSTETGLAKL